MRHILGLAYGVLFVEINCLRKIKEEREINYTNKKHKNLCDSAICLHPRVATGIKLH